MINRQLERIVKLLPDENLNGIREKIELEYYLLESEVRDLEELSGKIAYGIEIIKNPTNGMIEKETVKNLFCCKESVKQLLEKFANNAVTPIGLFYVLDDIVGT